MGTDSVIPKGRFAGLAWALLDDDAVDSEEADVHLTGALRPEEFIDWWLCFPQLKNGRE